MLNPAAGRRVAAMVTCVVRSRNLKIGTTFSVRIGFSNQAQFYLVQSCWVCSAFSLPTGLVRYDRGFLESSSAVKLSYCISGFRELRPKQRQVQQHFYG